MFTVSPQGTKVTMRFDLYCLIFSSTKFFKGFPHFKFEGRFLCLISKFVFWLSLMLSSSLLTILNLKVFPCVHLLFKQQFLTKQFFFIIIYALHLSTAQEDFTGHDVIRKNQWAKYIDREMPTCGREIEKESLQIWVSAFSRKTGDGQYFLTFLFGFCKRFFPGACLVGIYLYFSSLLPLSFFFASLYTRSMLGFMQRLDSSQFLWGTCLPCGFAQDLFLSLPKENLQCFIFFSKWCRLPFIVALLTWVKWSLYLCLLNFLKIIIIQCIENRPDFCLSSLGWLIWLTALP